MAESALETLLSVASQSPGAGRSEAYARILEPLGPLGAELASILARRNGFYAFESALHVLPLRPVPGAIDLDRWNTPSLWINTYGDLAAGHFFFGEDVFGGQFSISEGSIWSFEPETGVTEELASNFEGWAELVLGNYAVLTGHALAHEWQVRYGPIPLGKRLHPKTFFVIGGDYAVENLQLMNAVKGMRIRGQLASQLKGLPDGTLVEIDFGKKTTTT